MTECTSEIESGATEPYETREVEGRTLMLELRFKNGNSEGLPYAYLTRVLFDPSVGITIKYVGAEVVIRGRRLRGLYEALLLHKVEWLEEEDEFLNPRPETSPFISEITLSGSVPAPKTRAAGESSSGSDPVP